MDPAETPNLNPMPLQVSPLTTVYFLLHVTVGGDATGLIEGAEVLNGMHSTAPI